MKQLVWSIALIVLLAQAVTLCADEAAAKPRLVPTNNIAAARSRFPPSDFGRIAPTTPALEEYGLQFMLRVVNETREKWELDIPKPLTLSDVFFQLRATAFGIDGGIGTRDGRFNWAFSRNALEIFQDHNYWPRSFRYKADESARLARIKSKITAKEAQEIGQDALHKLGLSEKQLHLKKKPEVNQYTFEESNGTTYPLPVFNVTWRVEGPRRYSAENLEYSPVKMDISGITKKVAEYHNVVSPSVPLPTNYADMLNVSWPTNELQKRGLRPWPPKTNGASQSTNPSGRPPRLSE
jgi:hypothetical protein